MNHSIIFMLKNISSQKQTNKKYTLIILSFILKLLYLFYTHNLFEFHCIYILRVSQVALVIKNMPANAGDIRDMGLIPGSQRSPGGGHGNSCSILA